MCEYSTIPVWSNPILTTSTTLFLKSLKTPRQNIKRQKWEYTLKVITKVLSDWSLAKSEGHILSVPLLSVIISYGEKCLATWGPQWATDLMLGLSFCLSFASGSIKWLLTHIECDSRLQHCCVSCHVSCPEAGSKHTIIITPFYYRIWISKRCREVCYCDVSQSL